MNRDQKIKLFRNEDEHKKHHQKMEEVLKSILDAMDSLGALLLDPHDDYFRERLAKWNVWIHSIEEELLSKPTDKHPIDCSKCETECKEIYCLEEEAKGSGKSVVPKSDSKVEEQDLIADELPETDKGFIVDLKTTTTDLEEPFCNRSNSGKHDYGENNCCVHCGSEKKEPEDLELEKFNVLGDIKELEKETEIRYAIDDKLMDDKEAKKHSFVEEPKFPTHKCPECGKTNEDIPIGDYDIDFDYYCSYCSHHYNKEDIKK